MNTARYQQVTLLELLDRLLDKGVVVKGEILLSVADVDLVYLNLGLLLSSVKALGTTAGKDIDEMMPVSRRASLQEEEQTADLPQAASPQSVSSSFITAPQSRSKNGGGELRASTLPAAIDDGAGRLFAPRAALNPENVEKGLAKLVLTLVDLIRKLMEKQAVRRMDEEQLDTGEIEKLGSTFFLLDQKMEQLKQTFGLENEDLNIDLGPLGELL